MNERSPVAQETPGRPRGRFPVVTTLIILAWIVVYALACWTSADPSPFGVAPQAIVRWGGNAAPYTMDGEWWRLLTNKFLHQTLFTLAFVAWMFWDAGRVVERVYGRLGLLVVYFGATLTSSLATLAFSAPNKVVSGSVSATLAAFGAIVGYVLAVRSADLLQYLRPIRFSGPALALWLAWTIYNHQLDFPATSVGLLTGFLLGITLAPTGEVPGAGRNRAMAWPLALAVVALVAGVVWTQLKDPPYLISEARRLQHTLQSFQATNDALVDRKDALLQRVRGGAPLASIAGEVEQDQLPAWRRFREDLRAAPDRPGVPDVEYVAPMRRYVDAQVRYLEAVRDAARTEDEGKLAEVGRRRAEVDAALEEIRAISEKKTAEKGKTK